MNYSSFFRTRHLYPILFVFTLATIFLLGACQKDNLSCEVFNSEVSRLSKTPNLPPELSIPVLDDTMPSNPDPYTFCITKNYSWNPGYSEPLLLGSADGMFPGQLYNDLFSLGQLQHDGERAGLDMTISLLSTNNEFGEKGAVTYSMESPSYSDYQNGLNFLLQQNIDVEHAAFIDYTQKELFSSKQLEVAIGAEVNGAKVGELTGRVDFGKSEIKSRHLVKFIQKYFTVSVDIPDNPCSFFECLPTSIDAWRHSPLYVESMTYGRIVMLLVESAKSSKELTLALDAAFNSIKVDGTIDIDIEYQNILNESTMQILIVGGDASDGLESVLDIDQLATFLRSGGKYDSTSVNGSLNHAALGVPISYKLRYMNDNSVAKMVLSSEYSITECSYTEPYLVDAPRPNDNSSFFYFCPKLLAGNRNWSENGPRVDLSVSLSVEDDSVLMANVHGFFQEEVADGSAGDTQALIDERIRITAIPSRYKFVDFETNQETTLNFLDTTKNQIESFEFGPESPVAKFLVQGDVTLHDFNLGACLGKGSPPILPNTHVGIKFNPITLIVAQRED